MAARQRLSPQRSSATSAVCRRMSEKYLQNSHGNGQHMDAPPRVFSLSSRRYLFFNPPECGNRPAREAGLHGIFRWRHYMPVPFFRLPHSTLSLRIRGQII